MAKDKKEPRSSFESKNEQSSQPKNQQKKKKSGAKNASHPKNTSHPEGGKRSQNNKKTQATKSEKQAPKKAEKQPAATKKAEKTAHAPKSGKNGGRRTSARLPKQESGNKGFTEAVTQIKENLRLPKSADKRGAKGGKRGAARTAPVPTGKLKIIPLGGLNEIGKNMTAIEYENDIIVIDCGLGFPDDDMLGIDLVIPDISYLEANREKIRGIFLTHGHEDHIGAIPYVLRQINPPIYGTKLTLGIIKNKLSEHKLPEEPKLNCVAAGDVIRTGCFTVEFIS